MLAGYPVEPIDIHPSIRHLECIRDLATLTDKTVAVLRTVVAESRESRDSRSLAEGLAVSAGATLVFITLLYLLGRLQAWITRRLAAAIDARAERLKLGGTELIRADIRLNQQLFEFLDGRSIELAD